MDIGASAHSFPGSTQRRAPSPDLSSSRSGCKLEGNAMRTKILESVPNLPRSWHPVASSTICISWQHSATLLLPSPSRLPKLPLTTFLSQLFPYHRPTTTNLHAAVRRASSRNHHNETTSECSVTFVLRSAPKCDVQQFDFCLRKVVFVSHLCLDAKS